MNISNLNNNSQIVLYKTTRGIPDLKVTLEGETVWLTQKQMANLFDKTIPTINEHIQNIFKEKELNKRSVIRKFRITATDGKSYISNSYNLDMIISVGYRVNSKRGTQFRLWATKILKDYLIKGFTINQKRLQEKNLSELEKALILIKKTVNNKELNLNEATGLLKVITTYADSWLLLQKYDENSLTIPIKTTNINFQISYEEAISSILELKNNLLKLGTVGDLFGIEREKSLQAILATMNQTFNSKDLYPTIEEKAAHLLYFVIKDHPFTDGNKRSACLLFILFLKKNNYLVDKNGNLKFNDNALVALALLIAQSNPKEKKTMITLIMNLIN